MEYFSVNTIGYLVVSSTTNFQNQKNCMMKYSGAYTEDLESTPELPRQ